MRNTMVHLSIASVCVTMLLQVAHSSTLRENGNGPSLGIYGGHRVSIKEVPYMAAVLQAAFWGSIIRSCGGSIIHRQFILSAAHCALFESDPILEVYVQVGSATLIPDIDLFIKVENMYWHKDYKLNVIQNDICLFKLKTPVAFGPTVALIQLADEDFEFKEGALTTISGWGATEEGPWRQLRQVSIPLIDEARCRRTYRNWNTTDKEFCAGSENHGVCKGDSGSPILYDGKQIGIAVAGPAHEDYSQWCGSKFGDIYLKVTKYRQWINDTIAKHL